MILYLEPFGGLAGDMLLAALLDLADERFRLEDLQAFAERILPGECRLALREVRRGGFRARLLEVATPESSAATERHLAELLELLECAGLAPRARAVAGGVLRRLAAAEAAVHGLSIDEVHFHEVGAVDTLIDVGGAALALERLGIERVLASVPYAGGGTLTCAHGELPVPAPGAAECLRGLPVRHGPGGERITPTGAALLAELVAEFEPACTFTVVEQGYGAGQRDPAQGPPNLVRVSLCRAESARGAPPATVWQLECNLDDATGEEIAFLLRELRAAGALDAWTVPIQMKKERPGAIVCALARPADRAALETVVFAHSPTLGVRWGARERTECGRSELTLEIEGRPVRIKVRRRPSGELEALDCSPEHEDLAELARSSGRSIRSLERQAIEQALAELARRVSEPH